MGIIALYFCFTMVRPKGIPRKKGRHSADIMLQAIALTRQGKGIRKAAK